MIDILMTVYNGEQYVVPQIESILNQTDSNWKLFIQDDCSTDRTVELIEPYVRRYPERNTLLRNEKNRPTDRIPRCWFTRTWRWRMRI